MGVSKRNHCSRKVTVLLGAGRGGTTLLYKILALHRGVGYISNYTQRWPGLLAFAALNRIVAGLPKLKRRTWFKAEGGAFFNGRREHLHRMVPTPNEGEAIYSRCGIPLAPEPGAVPDPIACARLGEAFGTMLRWSGAQVLVTKRTANNRRIAWLKAALPEARYIHLVRDGRAVAHSLLRVNWWDDHIVFWAGKSPREMVSAGADALGLAARNWVEEMKAIEAGLELLDPSRVLEVRYEDLISRPEAEIYRLLDFIGATVDADPAFPDLLRSLKLAPAEEAWSRHWSSQERDVVLGIQGPTLRRWGYES